MKKLLTKDFKFTVADSDDEKGAFTGYASVFGVVDSYGDVVMPGAFKRTLKERKQFPLLWSHNVAEPIGVMSGAEDEKGLWIEGQLNLDVERAREVRSLMKQGAVDGLSIGYQTVKEGVDKESGVRQLKEVKLWEVSVCVFQANPEATVDEVKQDLSEVEAQDSGQPAPAPEPPEDKSNPEEQHLHLLTEFRDNVRELSNLIEGVSQ